MTDKEDNILIQEYLRGELSVKEVSIVEGLIKKDASFREEFQNQKLVFETVVLSEIYKLESEIRAYKPSNTSEGSSWSSFFTIGFIGVLFFISSYFQPKLEKERINTVIKSNISGSVEKEEIVKIIDRENNSVEKFIVETRPKQKSEPDIIIDSIEKVITEMDKVSEELEAEENILPTIIQKKAPVIETDFCKDVVISYDLKESGTCKDDQTGSIIIIGITGGKEPYTIFLDQQETDDLSGLAAGKYTVTVKDIHECVSEKNLVTIPVIDCDSYAEEFVLSIYDQGYYLIPENVKIMVLSEQGEIVLNQYINDEFKWFGTDQNGNYLPFGTYNLVIRKSDGTRILKNISIID